MGMRNLGLLNIIATTLMIPVFYDIYLVHENKVLGLFGLLLFFARFPVFVSDNSKHKFMKRTGIIGFIFYDLIKGVKNRE